MKWFATWIMDGIAGSDCSEWASAMQREFDELEDGHIGWALGCLSTLSGRNLRVDWPFYLAIFLSAYFLIVPFGALVFPLALYDAKLYQSLFFAFDHLAQVPFALLLGFWRPTRAFTIMFLGGYLGYTCGGILYVMHSFGGDFSEWLRTDTVYQVIGRGGENAFLATMIDLAVWYLAASLGGRLRVQFGSRKPQLF